MLAVEGVKMSPVLFIHKIYSDGRVEKLEDTSDLRDLHIDDGFLWMHFDSQNQGLRAWLSENTRLDKRVIESLIREDTRPNILKFKKGELLTLRGMNFNEDYSEEDMIALNIWVEERMIITCRNQKILAINDISTNLYENNRIRSVGVFLSELISLMNNRIVEVIESIDDKSDELEEKILNKEYSGVRNDLSRLRRKAVQIRRYLIPQREVLNRLYMERFPWIDDDDMFSLRSSSERLVRAIEDLDAIREHLSLAQEELSNLANEEMNQTMYVVAIISTLFLPLGFITGLFGINVGGMPGIDKPDAFYVVVLICAVTLVIEYSLFKLKKKL